MEHPDRYHRIPFAQMRRSLANLVFGHYDITPVETPTLDDAAAAERDREEALRIRAELDLDALEEARCEEPWHRQQ